MDFIERILGISPDAGSGASELMLVIAFALLLALLGTRKYLRRI
jgi:hypothetical protein